MCCNLKNALTNPTKSNNDVQNPLASANRTALRKSLTPTQVRNIGLEVSPSGITVGDFIQGADAVDDTCELSLQDRDEAGDRAENKGRRRCLRHHL